MPPFVKQIKETFCNYILKLFKIFPKQAIGTISSSTRILSEEMINMLISLNYLFSYISESQCMMEFNSKKGG